MWVHVDVHQAVVAANVSVSAAVVDAVIVSALGSGSDIVRVIEAVDAHFSPGRAPKRAIA